MVGHEAAAQPSTDEAEDGRGREERAGPLPGEALELAHEGAGVALVEPGRDVADAL